MHKDKNFYSFQQDISDIPLPNKFTFPFAYEPNALTLLAAELLQKELENIYDGTESSGKMFGVLVVKSEHEKVGYLVGFSGQLEDYKNDINFVPPVHDRLQNQGFFKKEEEVISDFTKQIRQIENDEKYRQLQDALKQMKGESAEAMSTQKALNEKAKEQRAKDRTTAEEELSGQKLKDALKKIDDESIEQHYQLKRLNEKWTSKVGPLQSKIAVFEKEIGKLKTLRKKKSGALQQRLFQQYQFLNIRGERQGLSQIFEPLGQPPAGAGDCAGPKLLQYAFSNNYQPIAMGEFWWGKPPKTQLRKQGRFYPACSGKCKPILGHMLKGLTLEPDPILQYDRHNKQITIIYEDEHLLVINKPAGLLSIPSKLIQDAVSVRMQTQFPNATGPMVAHRLDKMTSGLMIITKSLEVYKAVQQQFINKTIQKTYSALLDGKLKKKNGIINLPLAVDEFNRPMQMVSFEKGKKAETQYEVIAEDNNQTLVKFKPITGRTHQLRVHAAHQKGLNAPIIGDTLYGIKAERLMLHAASITFIHPINGKG